MKRCCSCQKYLLSKVPATKISTVTSGMNTMSKIVSNVPDISIKYTTKDNTVVNLTSEDLVLPLIDTSKVACPRCQRNLLIFGESNVCKKCRIKQYASTCVLCEKILQKYLAIKAAKKDVTQAWKEPTQLTPRKRASDVSKHLIQAWTKAEQETDLQLPKFEQLCKSEQDLALPPKQEPRIIKSDDVISDNSIVTSFVTKVDHEAERKPPSKSFKYVFPKDVHKIREYRQPKAVVSSSELISELREKKEKKIITEQEKIDKLGAKTDEKFPKRDMHEKTIRKVDDENETAEAQKKPKLPAFKGESTITTAKKEGKEAQRQQSPTPKVKEEKKDAKKLEPTASKAKGDEKRDKKLPPSLRKAEETPPSTAKGDKRIDKKQLPLPSKPTKGGKIAQKEVTPKTEPTALTAKEDKTALKAKSDEKRDKKLPPSLRKAEETPPSTAKGDKRINKKQLPPPPKPPIGGQIAQKEVTPKTEPTALTAKEDKTAKGDKRINKKQLPPPPPKPPIGGQIAQKEVTPTTKVEEDGKGAEKPKPTALKAKGDEKGDKKLPPSFRKAEETPPSTAKGDERIDKKQKPTKGGKKAQKEVTPKTEPAALKVKEDKKEAKEPESTALKAKSDKKGDKKLPPSFLKAEETSPSTGKGDERIDKKQLQLPPSKAKEGERKKDIPTVEEKEKVAIQDTKQMDKKNRSEKEKKLPLSEKEKRRKKTEDAAKLMANEPTKYVPTGIEIPNKKKVVVEQSRLSKTSLLSKKLTGADSLVIKRKLGQYKNIMTKRKFLMRGPSYDDIILKLAVVRDKKLGDVRKSPSSKFIVPKKQLSLLTFRSDLELDLDSLINKRIPETNDKVKNNTIVPNIPDKPPLLTRLQREPKGFNITYEIQEPKITVEEFEDEDKETLDEPIPKGLIRYVLSDRTYIENGWTQLPAEKVVRKMYVYRMRPAYPEFDWFAHNKAKGALTYDTGEKLADIDEKGRGRWYYKNGRTALDYYDCEETNAQQRFVIYSNGIPNDKCSFNKSKTVGVLAMFDYIGNGVVFDHSGKVRLKYNQSEGVLLDRKIGPPTHWKWHCLNDPPTLQRIMIDTQLLVKDPTILEIGCDETKVKDCDEEMLAIEFNNFLKEKAKKLNQKFRPFQIQMKALKINEYFSLKILDQSRVYLIYRDGLTTLRMNLGMILDDKEIIDTDTADVGEVPNTFDRPGKTESVMQLQKNLHETRRVDLLCNQRENRVRFTLPVASADRLVQACSRPLRPIIFPRLHTETCACSTEHATAINRHKGLDVYSYNTLM